MIVCVQIERSELKRVASKLVDSRQVGAAGRQQSVIGSGVHSSQQKRLEQPDQESKQR